MEICGIPLTLASSVERYSVLVWHGDNDAVGGLYLRGRRETAQWAGWIGAYRG